MNKLTQLLVLLLPAAVAAQTTKTPLEASSIDFRREQESTSNI